MTFKEYSHGNNEKIHQTISRYLPDREPRAHYRMVRDYPDRRGKYHRPNLALLWCELYGGKPADVFLIACALQLVQDFFLVHDDWMDRNEVRRGKPAAHALYGDVFAVNAGDALLTLIWKLVHDGTRRAPTPATGDRLFEKFHDIILTTIEGQYLDLALAREPDITRFTLDDYWRSIHAKSAYYSVYGPMQLGAIAAGRPGEDVDATKEYGIPLGKAFQTRDDILDCTGTEESLGKTVGNDVYEGTKTAILWHFVQQAEPRDLDFVKGVYAKQRVDKTAAEVARVLELFTKAGSIAFAEQLVDDLAREGQAAFEEHMKGFPDSPLKAAARDAIGQLRGRR